MADALSPVVRTLIRWIRKVLPVRCAGAETQCAGVQGSRLRRAMHIAPEGAIEKDCVSFHFWSGVVRTNAHSSKNLAKSASIILRHWALDSSSSGFGSSNVMPAGVRMKISLGSWYL